MSMKTPNRIILQQPLRPKHNVPTLRIHANAARRMRACPIAAI